MPNAANKVKFGLKNVHYAVLTLGDNGAPTFGTPVAIPGAVNLSLDAQAGSDPFRADDSDYYRGGSNGGYSGDLELAIVPDHFRTAVLGEIQDANGVFVEDAGAEGKPFALLFEFSGDVRKTRHVIYNCTAERPDVSSQTTERGQKTPVTETLTITTDTVYNASLGKDVVKSRSGPDTDATVYDGWYESVYMAAAASEESGG
jgi:phi13 family phage major tail protein